MKAIVQRVKYGSVKVEAENYFEKIDKGFVILIGYHKEDTENEMDLIIKKIIGLRIFEDSENKMNLSIKDINGEILLISQFTLYADSKKGNRPGFSESMQFDKAKIFYELSIKKLQESFLFNNIKKGIFGKTMLVEIQNDGPVTIILDTNEL